MNNLRELYFKYPNSLPLPMVLDGATGTELMKRGMPRGVCTELWVLENPGVINEIHAGYAAAGSDAICAPTFGANAPSLERHGVGRGKIINGEAGNGKVGNGKVGNGKVGNGKVGNGDVGIINERLVALARNTGKLLIGDLSPTGLFLEPFGDAAFDEVVEIYANQAAALERAGVDLFLSETNISLAEARAAVTGIKSVSEKPVFVSLTVDANRRTLSGDTLEAAFLTLADLGISAFGANCSVGPKELVAALSPLVQLSIALGIPLLAKPNSGMPCKNPDGSEGFGLSPSEMAAFAPEIYGAGILIAGGCCGSDSRFVAALRRAANAYDGKLPYSGALPDVKQMAATNRSVFTIDPADIAHAAPYSISDELADEEGAYLYVRLDSREDADALLEFAYTLPPLALTGDAESVRYFRRYYNGRAVVIDSTGE